MALPSGGDGQKGQGEVPNITWDYAEQELGLKFPMALTESEASPAPAVSWRSPEQGMLALV